MSVFRAQRPESLRTLSCCPGDILSLLLKMCPYSMDSLQFQASKDFTNQETGSPKNAVTMPLDLSPMWGVETPTMSQTVSAAKN